MAEKTVCVGLVAKIRGKLVSPANIDFKKMFEEEGIIREDIIDVFQSIKPETLKLFEAKKVPFKKELEAKKRFLDLWDGHEEEYFYQLDDHKKEELKSAFDDWVSSCSNQARLDKVFDFYGEMYGCSSLYEGVCFLKNVILSKTLKQAQELYGLYAFDFDERASLSIIMVASFYRLPGRHPKMPKFLPPSDGSENEKSGLLVIPGHYVGFF